MEKYKWEHPAWRQDYSYISAYPKLDDHFQIVIKLVILSQCHVGQLSQFISICLFLLPANKQPLEEWQQALHNNSTYLVTCTLVWIGKIVSYRQHLVVYIYWAYGQYIFRCLIHVALFSPAHIPRVGHANLQYWRGFDVEECGWATNFDVVTGSTQTTPQLPLGIAL